MTVATAPAPPPTVSGDPAPPAVSGALAPPIRVLALGTRDTGASVRVPVDRVCVLLLDPSPERAERVGGALADDELARAARVRPGRGAKFTAVRGTLRVVLARELAMPAREVPIVYADHGKPALDPALGSDVRFNVSHTGGLAAIALARGRDVGVDVERHRPRRRLELLARATLTPNELARYGRLPADERLAKFLDAWTAKEAYSKLRGRGLGLSFDRLELDAVRPAIARLATGPRHSGALAVGSRHTEALAA